MNKRIEDFFTISSIISLIASVITILSQNILIISIILGVTSLLFFLYAIGKSKSPINFEVLEETICIDIVDSSGKIAKYSKKSQLKSTKANAYYFYYSLTAFVGRVENIKIINGIIESISETNGYYFITSKMNKILKKGEVVERELQCDFINALTSNKEYWVYTKNYHGSKLRLTIIFPKDRNPKTFSSHYKIGHFEELTKNQPVKSLNEDNRVLITLDINAKLFTDYILKWEW